MHYLVTGGGGYIGSHVARDLLGRGARVTVVDNLSTGSMVLVDALQSAGGADLRFVPADLNDSVALEKVFKQASFDAVFHFAASSVVGESMVEPEKYRINNVESTAHLLRCCTQQAVRKFVFSSTASVYGEPGDKLVKETAALKPVSIYGETKLQCERKIMETATENAGFHYMIFRFFNVAGASHDGKLGEVTPVFCHLIKAAVQAALGIRENLSVFGDDYNTPDGTGIRDYIHVEDLAAAHVAALGYLETRGSNIFNVGYGNGCSVYQVIEKVKEISGTDFKVEVIPRRAGDPAYLVADVEKIKAAMDWQPRYAGLDSIVRSAFEWERRLRAI